MFRIKICGITDVRDAMACAEAGADAVGLNFCAASPRYIDLDRAREICQSAPGSVTRVGVFVDAPLAQMLAAAEQLELGWLQLHGDEPPEMIADLAPVRVMRAYRARNSEYQPLLEYLDSCDRRGALPAAILVDAYQAGSHGGTGKTVDWTFVRELANRLNPLPVVLAGGLRAENIAEAIRVGRPAAVDTASGVEAEPGRKDPELVNAFVANARRAFDLLSVGEMGDALPGERRA